MRRPSPSRWSAGLGATALLMVHGHVGLVPSGPRLAEVHAQSLPANAVNGSWSGRWMDEHGRHAGSVEVILTPGTASGEVLGQFTFLVGADARTARREGKVTDGVLRFDLVGGGEIVLRPAGNDLVGEFRDPRRALPAPRGHLELSRAR